MIYTLTTNPSIDYYLYGKNDICEGIIHPDDYEFIVAGKGVNVSKMLARLNKETKCIVVCGGFTGDYIASELEKEEKLNHVIVRNNENTRINVKTRFNGIEIDFNSYGPSLLDAAKQELIDVFDQVQAQDYVCINGSLQKGMKDTIITIAKKVCAKQAKLILDVPNLTKEEILACSPYLIKPNQDELCKLLNEENLEELIYKAQNVFAKNGIHVLLSLGEKGSCYIAKDEILKVLCPKIDEVVNTVAAGDSLLAGFICKLSDDKNIYEALTYASACGSASVSSSYLPTKELVDSLVDKVIVKNYL
ncbi:MAG: hexose kinase [Erysipelotrichaceae bacterium]|nr:hexose kinase [Erysipelotrichaceae bacterium]